MHYVELQEGVFKQIAPLASEIPNTEFYNGTVMVVPEGVELSVLDWKEYSTAYPGTILKDWLDQIEPLSVISMDSPVWLYHTDHSPYTTAEFSTNDRCGNGYIQRL